MYTPVKELGEKMCKRSIQTITFHN